MMRMKVILSLCVMFVLGAMLVIVGPGPCGDTCEDLDGTCVEGTLDRQCPRGTTKVSGREDLCPVEEGEPSQICCVPEEEDPEE